MANCMNTSCAKTQNKRFFGKRVLNSLYLEPTNVYEVADIISSLNPHKSPGVDDIPTKLIKAAKHVLSPYLSKLINYCLKNGRNFDELKLLVLHHFTKEVPNLTCKTIAQYQY